MTKQGYFGNFGGQYVPEMLRPALEELASAYKQFGKDPEFLKELNELFTTYSGRPTPLYRARGLEQKLYPRRKAPRIFLKLESLNHTGAHKINNALGQALLARRMGKKKLIAETGAGQHGVATATAAARFGLECQVFMGEVDVRRQYPNVYAMQLLGAEVIPVKEGQRTLKDAVNAAMKEWITTSDESHYLLGSALGPHPYPTMVRDFQSVIGREVRQQLKTGQNLLPTALIACVGGGSNSLGLFHPFIGDKDIKMFGIEAGGRGNNRGDNAVRFTDAPRTGIVQGYRSLFIMDDDGQVEPTHSISAGLDYPGVGPELAHLYEEDRITFSAARDDQALEGFKTLTRTEGILPALESSHAVGWLIAEKERFTKDDTVVVNISGRGDKDLFITAPLFDPEGWKEFLATQMGDDK